MFRQTRPVSLPPPPLPLLLRVVAVTPTRRRWPVRLQQSHQLPPLPLLPLPPQSYRQQQQQPPPPFSL